MRNQIRPFVLICIPLILAGCGGKDEAEGPQYNSAIALESLNPDGCLNVPAYFTGVLSLDPNIAVLEVSTDFSYKSKKWVREKFGDLMAYTTFRAGTRPRQEFHEFTSLGQNGCAEILVHAADGSTEAFPVKNASSDSLRAEAPDGRLLQYTWLSPTRMIIEISYHAYDMPCGNEEPVLIHQRRVLDWSGTPLESLDLGKDPFNMSASYLAKVADSVGISASTLYHDGAINAAKVGEMASRPPLPELLSCPDGGLPPPRNPDEDPEVPTDP